MPHVRARHLSGLLRKALGYSPIVAVFGHRQVGKTTLASEFSAKYATLDLEASLVEAEAEPMLFLERNAAKPLVIDECQLAPKLFPALKEWVRIRKAPGQFLLTGSVRFSSRKAIRESLTGRVIAWELLPMDMSETYEAPLPDTLSRLLRAKSVEIALDRSAYATEAAIARYLRQGGLPGIFAIRDESIRRQRFETQINTLLERDLKLIQQTTLSYRVLRHLLALLAERNGAPLDLAALNRETRISVPTLKKLLSAFEAMFLIRILPTEGSQKRPVVFFEDIGEANALFDHSRHPLNQLTAFLFNNLRAQVAYRPDSGISIFQFRNRGGSLVPLCFRAGGACLGIIPILEETPDLSAIRSARSFVGTYRDAKVLLVHRGAADRIIDRRIRVVGAAQLV
ncbi:MAG: AAA family ATPase [Oligoflexia bacterium]|nr:AAA family ATPase [Oligoflexia bacterium]